MNNVADTADTVCVFFSCLNFKAEKMFFFQHKGTQSISNIYAPIVKVYDTYVHSCQAHYIRFIYLSAK